MKRIIALFCSLILLLSLLVSSLSSCGWLSPNDTDDPDQNSGEDGFVGYGDDFRIVREMTMNEDKHLYVFNKTESLSFEELVVAQAIQGIYARTNAKYYCWSSGAYEIWLEDMVENYGITYEYTTLEEMVKSYIRDYGNDYVEGYIDLPAGQELIFTTIPYDEGWKVYIDGEEAETVMVLDSLLAVPATAGGHEIKFVYRPDCAVYGGLISVIGILAFVLLVVWSRVRRVRALAKCDNGSKHFFYHDGDTVSGWLLESAEEDACELAQKTEHDGAEAPENDEGKPPLK